MRVISRWTLILASWLLLMVCTGGSAWAQAIDFSKPYARMGVGVLGGGAAAAAGPTAYCTGAATCTATNPGECDRLCEDGEGSSNCDADDNPDLDANCRATGTGVIGSGDSIDTTATAGGTYPCTGTANTNVLEFVVSAASRSTYILRSFTATDDVYFQFYFNLTAESFGDNGNGDILDIIDSGGNNCAVFYVKESTGNAKTLKTAMRNTSSAFTYVSGTTSIVTGTWYRVTGYAKKSTGTYRFYVDGVAQCDEQTNYQTALQHTGVYLGPVNAVANTAAFTVQLDNIAIDSSAIAGACQ